MAGNSGHRHTEETKKKIGRANSLKMKEYFKNHPEARERMRTIHLNKPPWNKGLTKEMDNRVRLNGLHTGISLVGKRHTQEWKQLMSQKFKGENNPFYGKSHTDQTKKLIAMKNTGKISPMKGKHQTEEAKLKSKLAHIGSKPWNIGLKGMHYSPKTEFKKGLIPWNKGIPISESAKERIRAKLKGRKSWNTGRTKYTDERLLKGSIQMSITKLPKNFKEPAKEELEKLYKIEKRPLADIATHFAVSVGYINKLFKKNNIAIDQYLQFGKKQTCLDGHIVKSSMERNVDEWLFSHNIPHSYEQKLLGNKKYFKQRIHMGLKDPVLSLDYREFRTDFFVGNVHYPREHFTGPKTENTAFYIEILGMKGKLDYDKKWEDKKKVYDFIEKAYTIGLITIEKIKDLDKKLGFLVPLFSRN